MISLHQYLPSVGPQVANSYYAAVRVFMKIETGSESPADDSHADFAIGIKVMCKSKTRGDGECCRSQSSHTEELSSVERLINCFFTHFFDFLNNC